MILVDPRKYPIRHPATMWRPSGLAERSRVVTHRADNVLRVDFYRMEEIINDAFDEMITSFSKMIRAMTNRCDKPKATDFDA